MSDAVGRQIGLQHQVVLPRTAVPRPAVINVSDLIEAAPIGALQCRVVALCAVLALLDGFDTQAIAFVAPVLTAQWHIDLALLGPVFAASLAGLMIGALAFGPASDRIGRKPALIASTLIFGIFAAATAYVTSTSELLALRFLTGIGLGGAMPNIIALTSEYTPKRARATAISLMFCGFPLGAVLGGLLATWIIPRWGWPLVFVLGGAAPLAIVPVLALMMPESARFAVVRRRSQSGVQATLAAIAPHADITGATLDVGEQSAGGFPLKQLFTERRHVATVLLWIVFFASLLVLYFLVNWLPSLLHRSGLPLQRAIVATVVLNAGGIVGAIVLGRLIDRFGPTWILAAAYALAAGATAALGPLSSTTPVLLLGVVFVAGFGVIGGQICMNAFAAAIYPTAMRSTGVGWALGVGRLGSIVGPIIGGMLIAGGFTVDEVFLCAALIIVAACAALIGLRTTARRTHGEAP
jgi:MFS transporter, AAHS family, 4-hydroxybenzoate transporter